LVDGLVARNLCEVHYLTHFIDDRARTRNYAVSLVGNGGPIPRLGYLMDGPSLYRRLRQINPEVIYQRVACAYTGICALYARRHSVPMIWHVAHDSDVASYLLEPVRNVLRRHLETWAIAYGARRATAVVVQTHHQAALLQQNHRRTAAAVIPNFHPAPAETIDKSGPLTVIWIANLKPWKRPELFVRLAARFSTRPEVRFIMVGLPAAVTGNSAWRDSLMRGIEAVSNLEYLGHKTHAEVNELLARAHVFVNTSTHEGFPNTFIQAWLRDVAVVSLDVDPDGVLQNKGVGIRTRTESDLETVVGKLLDDADLRAAYARRGREHATARHSLDNVRQLIELIGSYANRAGG
jgi:glycosyltransferase involved in cell wall biosynthesis